MENGGFASGTTRRTAGPAFFRVDTTGSSKRSANSAQKYGPLRFFEPRAVDRIFGALFIVDGSRGRASSFSDSFAGLFSAPGLFPPQSGLEAAVGPSAGHAADHGIFGSRGIRFPGVGGTTELVLNVLGGLILLAVLLVGLSAVPPRVIESTPFPVQTFLRVRPYLAVFGTSILLSAGLIYGLGTLRL